MDIQFFASGVDAEGNDQYNFGWQDKPEEVKKVLSTLEDPFFAQSARELMNSADDKKDGLLYLAHKKIFGKHLIAQQQPAGTCVSRGWSRACDHLQLRKMLKGAPIEFKMVSHSFIYGGSREIGGDLSWSDGSVGAWAAKCVNKWGICTREEIGDVPQGNDDLARQWAAKGVPQKYKDLAKDNLVTKVSMVRTAEEAKAALVNLFPISVCSNRGFTTTRDSKGFCRPSGVWNHCMEWSGYDDELKRFLVEQSWGQMMPSGPLYKDQPDNSFWIDWDVADSMLRQEDSFVLYDLDAWMKDKIDWFI